MKHTYYKDFNAKYKERYEASIVEIKVLVSELNVEEKFKDYFKRAGSFAIEMYELEKELNDEFFSNKTFSELKEFNESLFKDVIGDAYHTSYANPTYAIEQLGDEAGHVFMYVYTEILNYTKPVFEHEIVTMTKFNELLVKLYNNTSASKEELCQFVRENGMEFLDDRVEMGLRIQNDPDCDIYTSIVTESDLKDLRYLFKYGKYISDNEIKSARHLLSLPKDKVEKMAEIEFKAFLKGCEDSHIDVSKKTSVNQYYQLGFERLIKKVIKKFDEIGLRSMTFRDSFKAQRLRMVSTRENPQYSYDHKFDDAIFYNQEYADAISASYKKAIEKLSPLLKGFAGPALQESFGQKPFSPATNPNALKMSDDQSKIEKATNSIINIEMNKVLPRSEYSFVITTYPLPEIGEKYEEIFDAVIEVNCLDSDKFEKIHDYIIDVLDQGDYVKVKGMNGNDTELTVNLCAINDPEKETIFENCVATVNVPVGEVFTSPTLKGTTGLLHVSEVYLQGLKYENLRIQFENGYTKEYSCSNFDTEEEGKKFIYDNLLHPNKELPLGEFAIGTNTYAYVMGRKYGINDLLPILIAEKTGPHFAIGDTCFSWSEDNKVYNPNGKEIIARDNEHSIQRKEDPSKAYTYRHTDITIPYDELDTIIVVTHDNKEIEIIRGGRFVLPGTEELNKAFEK